MQRNISPRRRNGGSNEHKDEPILMAAVTVNEFDEADDGLQPSPWTNAVENVARFATQNLTVMGLEYMVMASNAQMYQGMINIATSYYMSPMALLGRGLMWAERGALAFAYKEERPENLKEIAKSAISDLFAVGFIGLVYWGGCNLDMHTQLLAEIVVIDSFVVSGASSLFRAAASKLSDCSQGIHWKFWQKKSGLASINMDLLDEKEDSPPTPIQRLQVLPTLQERPDSLPMGLSFRT
jgi:hypothetical protein